MKKYYIKCVETCPDCFGNGEFPLKDKWEKCKKCSGTGKYTHDVDLETAMEHDHHDQSASMRI